MFRRPLLPCACLAVALALAVSVAPTPVHGQDHSTQERLDRLERDLNMLQRQVYRGAPPPATSGDDGAAVNAEIRMDRLESQMRDLAGHVEEVANKIAQIRQRVEQINGDIEMRFNQLGAGAGATVAAKSAPERLDPGDPRAARQRAVELPDAVEDELTPPRFSSAAGSGAPRPGTAVPAPSEAGPVGLVPGFGTLTPPGPSARAPDPASAPAAERSAAGLLPSGSATGQYNQAFGLLKEANYPAAEAAFKAFLEQHPKDPMAGNAQYWLGETYYTRARYLDAASAFAEGYKRYPKSAKAADNLLKLGMSLARANQKQNACVALAQLDRDFPNAGAAVKAHAAAEKKRLGC